MTNRRLTAPMMILALFAVTCGGSVVEREGDAGSAGDDGAAGDKGTGGAVSKGGSGPGGAPTYGGSGPGGGGPAGSGAYGGYAGSGAQGGWAGAGGDVCPPLPSCNWCNGKPYYDGMGCVAGWICANGVNPCYTQPCWNAGCPAGQTCAPDGLCWDSPNVCSPKMCTGTFDYCECFWSCGPDKYQTKCKVSGSSMSCECQQNGMGGGMGCGTAGGGGGSPPSCQDSCCGFPQ